MKLRRIGRGGIGKLLAAVMAIGALGLASLAAASETTNGPAAVETSSAAATNRPPAVDPEVLLRAIDDLRQQVDATSKELLDQTARDAEALSRTVDAAVADRLATMERGLVASQQRELELLRSSHRSFLTFAGVLAGLGFLGIIVAAVVLARAVNRFSEVALSLPGPGHALPAPPERAALGPGDQPAPTVSEVTDASVRFQEAVKRLEERIRELESLGTVAQATHEGGGVSEGVADSPVQADSALKLIASAVEGKHARPVPAAATTAAGARPPSEFTLLLGKGQALLNLGKAQEALACFEEAVALEPRNADAHVKRGLALERLQRMDQAIESYDQALAVDASSTLAYLYKGAVCNRLQRFQEALDCYEKALKTEQMSAAV